MDSIITSLGRRVFAKVNLRNLEYLIQETFIGIKRNGIMAVASISTVALSMAVLGAFILLIMGSHRFAERQLARFEIAVYLPNEASHSDAVKVRDAISKLPLTKRVDLITKEKAWQEFKKSMSSKLDLGGVVRNPLPYTLFAESKDSRKNDVLAEQIRNISGVEEVDNAEARFGQMRAIADLIKVLGFGAVLILCFTTVFVIGNAIRLTLFARRHELRIMQLVGATNWFIRVPLVLEGIVLGAAGAVIAVGMISLGSGYVCAFVLNKIPPMMRDLSSGVDPVMLLLLLVAGGMAIGALGSTISIRRFLRT